MLGGLVSHANARLTVHGRAELVRRVVEQGRPVAHVVVELNVSRATGYKWLARWRSEGAAGLADRSSRASRPEWGSPVGRLALLSLVARGEVRLANSSTCDGLLASTV